MLVSAVSVTTAFELVVRFVASVEDVVVEPVVVPL
jgi:hypothetical protein